MCYLETQFLTTVVVIEKSGFKFLDLKTHFPTNFSHENT